MLLSCLTSPLTVCLLLLLGLYGALSVWIEPKHLIEFTDGLDIAFALAVAGVYRRRVIQALCHRSPDVYDLLLTGIAGGWFVNALDRAWRLYARTTENFELLNSHFIGFLLTALMFFAALHLIVKGSANAKALGDEGISPEAWHIMGWAAVAGSVIGGLAVAYSMWV